MNDITDTTDIKESNMATGRKSREDFAHVAWLWEPAVSGMSTNEQRLHVAVHMAFRGMCRALGQNANLSLRQRLLTAEPLTHRDRGVWQLWEAVPSYQDRLCGDAKTVQNGLRDGYGSIFSDAVVDGPIADSLGAVFGIADTVLEEYRTFLLTPPHHIKLPLNTVWIPKELAIEAVAKELFPNVLIA